MTTQKIVPCLWFDREAREAAEFHVAAFGGDSAVTSATFIPDTPSGDAEVVRYRLFGYEFMALSGGPFFRINPSVSFIVNFDPAQRPDAREALEALWKKLAAGGTVLMPLAGYPFSERYGWVQDRYGVSWQLILAAPERESRPSLLPSLMFTSQACGKAEAAMKFYTSVFRNSREGIVARYGPDQAPDKEGTIIHEDFMLLGQWFAAMDSARPHDFSFSEGVSLAVNCETQEEIDSFWARLSAVPEAEQCGWLKDRFGLSWQIVPAKLAKLMSGPPEQRARVIRALLKMKKLDISALEAAYAARSAG